MMATLHELAPPASKATVLGFVLMVANLGGVALGPWITGAIGDRAGLTAGLLSSVVVGLLGLVVVALVVRRPAAPRLEAG
jgi:MFS family permease